MLDNQHFLYWTIIAIVSSNLTKYMEFYYLRIMTPYAALLEYKLETAPKSIHEIQALLFLCTWPLTCISGPDVDPCRKYIGVALRAARDMGLDTQAVPPSSETPEIGSEAQDRANTWIGCFYVATS